jgi:hypothetical protein
MSFEDDLKAIIEEAQEGRKQEDQETRDFQSAWEDKRKAVVFPVLRTAVAVLTPRFHGADTEMRNGSSIRLEAHWNGSAFLHSLTFRADKERREVEYSSSFQGDEKEWFTLDGLDQEAVEAKVRKFVKAIARGKWIEESIYEVQGLRSF